MDNTLEGQELFNKISQKVRGLFSENKLLKSEFLLYFVLVVLLVKIVSVVVYLPISQNFFFADITKIDLVNLLNDNRQNLGLNTLKESATLDQVAMAKAQDMVKNNYFAHQSPSGLSPWYWFSQAGYGYKYAGENLAVGFADSKTVYDAWFNSPSHKANLLNSHYTEVGTAVIAGFEGNAILVVQEFGNPLAKATSSASSAGKAAPPKKPVAVITVPKGTPAPRLIGGQAKPISTIEAPAVKTETVTEAIPAAHDALPTPAPVPAESNTVTIPQQVLGVSAQYIPLSDSLAKDTWYFRILNFIMYDYASILQYICWALLLLILGSLLFNIFLKTEFPNKILMFRSLVLVAVLIASLYINKELISQIIAGQIII